MTMMGNISTAVENKGNTTKNDGMLPFVIPFSGLFALVLLVILWLNTDSLSGVVVQTLSLLSRQQSTNVIQQKDDK